MSTTEKKIMFGLPLKIILTEDGASYFISRKKKLLRFRLADNADEYGIFFNKFFVPLCAVSSVHAFGISSS